MRNLLHHQPGSRNVRKEAESHRSSGDRRPGSEAVQKTNHRSCEFNIGDGGFFNFLRPKLKYPCPQLKYGGSVRLSDIALKLNVSMVTVSKAISGQKGVSEEIFKYVKN